MKTCSSCGQEKPAEQFVRAQCKPCRNQKIMEWRKANPEKCKAAKKKYYASVKGKSQKRKEDAAYVASGKRAVSEAKRADKPLSEARKQAKRRYQLMRRSGERVLDAFDAWVLSEAVELSKKREALSGGKWHVDHIIPVSRGGQCSYDNLQVVPAYWNRSKSNKHTGMFFPVQAKEI
jgi:CRISPR/Cas system Type II protein with McrA/HNH and RuvC-like nuclease domain